MPQVNPEEVGGWTSLAYVVKFPNTIQEGGMDGICTDSMNLVDFYGKWVGKYTSVPWIGMGYRNS